MTRRSEVAALLSKIEELERLAQALNDPVIDMLIRRAKGELAHILARAQD